MLRMNYPLCLFTKKCVVYVTLLNWKGGTYAASRRTVRVFRVNGILGLSIDYVSNLDGIKQVPPRVDGDLSNKAAKSRLI